jgi:multiple sugar transport system substrate-binding protein
VAACGGFAPPSAQPTAAARGSGGPLWLLDQANAGEPINRTMLERRFAEFEAAYPGAKIAFDAVAEPGASTEAKFRVLLAAGTLPDVVCTHTAIADQPPVLIDLNPYLAKDRTIKAADYFPTAFDAFKIPAGNSGGAGGARQVAIPRETHITLVYYNRDAVKAAGLAEPPRDWTLAQFVDVALKLTRWTDDPRTATWAIQGMTGVSGAQGGSGIYWQHGAEFFSADGKQCVIDRPEARAALQWLLDLIAKHHVAPSPKEEADSGMPAAQPDKLAGGRVAMYASNVNTSPLRATGQAQGLDWDIQALPQVPGRRRATRLAVPAYGLVTQGQHQNPDLGWELIKHLVGEEGARRWIEASGILMAHKKASEEWARHRGPSRNSKVAFEILEQWARLEQTRLPGWSQAMVPITREWTAVQNGQRALGEMIAIAKPEADAALARAQAS